MESTEDSLTDSNCPKLVETFDDLNLKELLLRGIYSYGFEKPSPIQQKGIRPIILGRDLIAEAQSGAGKTSTLSIGLLETIDVSISQCQALILVPTRELAVGTQQVILQLGQYLHAICHACMGGTVIREDIRILEKGAHVVVGTPGRVLNMIEKNHLSIEMLKILVLDEADEMLYRGFKDQIEEIFRHLQEKVQICLFSATFPSDISKLTTDYMRDPVRILVRTENLTLDSIAQYYIPIEKEEWKSAVLLDLYSCFDMMEPLIFVDTRQKAESLTKEMTERDYLAFSMYEEMDQTQIDAVMKQVTSRPNALLIITDSIISKIDLQRFGLIINYDMPRNNERYLHRIGRSGNFRKKKLVINFVTEGQLGFLKNLKEYYNTSIEELPDDLSSLF